MITRCLHPQACYELNMPRGTEAPKLLPPAPPPVSLATGLAPTAVAPTPTHAALGPPPILGGGLRGEVAHAAAQRIAALGIKLVCIDLDRTLLDIHTRGKWTAGPESLARCL